MYPIQTYRLTLWLPVAVTLLFLFILVFYSVNEYRHRLLDIKEVSKIQLQETALQLGHSLEYALANNDSLHARSSVAVGKPTTVVINAVENCAVNSPIMF